MTKKNVEEKQHTFLIWLLKEGITPEIIEEEIEEQCVDNIKKTYPPDAPENTVAFSWQSEGKKEKTWWQEYWKIEGNVSHSYPNAIVFIPCNDRWFAISQGYSDRYLKNEFIETQFPFYAVLNVLDPGKITTTKVFQPDESLRQLTQKSSGTSLIHLPHFNQYSTSIVRDLAGKVFDEYASLFSSISGGSAKALKINAIINPNQFDTYLTKLLERSKSLDYKKHFPQFNNIVQLMNSDLIDTLNEMLEASLAEDWSSIQLDLPDIIDQFEWIWRLTSLSSDFFSINEFTAENVLSQLQNHKGLTIDTLKQCKIQVKESEDSPKVNSFKLYSCITYDTMLSGDSQHRYFLVEGNWYEVSQDFLQKLDSGLGSLISAQELPFSLPPYNYDGQIQNENDYNTRLAECLGGICLDLGNISPPGQTQIEPCDVLFISGETLYFIHNKIFRASSNLSHLFNQGLASARMYSKDSETTNRLREEIIRNGTPDRIEQYTELLATKPKVAVLFGIIERSTTKTPHTLLSLPLFSKISLSNVLESLRDLHFESSVEFVTYT